MTLSIKNAFLHMSIFFYFYHTSLTCIFKIMSLCNAIVMVDVTPFFPLFVLTFQVGSRSFRYYLAVTEI